MNATSTTQTQYIQETNWSAKATSNDENRGILKADELLNEEANAFLNEIIDDMTDENQIFIKLLLSFQLSIKSESFIDGKFHIERETEELDTPTMLSKLELLIAKNKRSKGPLVNAMKYVHAELQTFYTNRNEVNTTVQNQEDSVIDEFIEDLYSKETINFKSSIIKDDIENKLNQHTSLMMGKRGDASMSELETAKLLNQYKNELLKEYKDSLESSSENTLSMQQQATVKVLLDKKVKETSSLGALLATTTVSTKGTKEI